MASNLGDDYIHSLQGKRRGVRILTLDGGGMKGYFELMVLDALEKNFHKPINELFDMICGTSTGGLIALALRKGVPVSELKDFYKQMGKVAFKKKFMGNVTMLTRGEMYDTEKFETLLESRFGATLTMDSYAEKLPKVFVVGATATLKPQEYLFRTYAQPEPVISRTLTKKSDAVIAGSDLNSVKMWEAARATTAAPGLFKPMSIGGSQYIDGALVANNPTSLAIQEAAILFPNSEIDLIVSLGCGFNEKKASQEHVNASMWSWGISTINVAIDAEKINREVKRWLTASKFKGIYKRLNPAGITGIHPDCTDFDVLDGASSKIQEYLQSAKVVQFFEDTKAYLQESSQFLPPAPFKRDQRKALSRKEGGTISVPAQDVKAAQERSLSASQSLSHPNLTSSSSTTNTTTTTTTANNSVLNSSAPPTTVKTLSPGDLTAPGLMSSVKLPSFNAAGTKVPEAKDDPELANQSVAYVGLMDKDEVSQRLLSCPEKTYLLRWSEKSGFVLSYAEKGKVLHVSGLIKTDKGLIVRTPTGEKLCKDFVDYIEIMKNNKVILNPITKYMDITGGYIQLNI